MQIFVLDKDPKKAARMHGDKHLVKAVLESAQLLSSAHWMTGGKAHYRLTHKNHPCSKWVRESLSNYLWLCNHALELCAEYTRRYDKTHKSESIIMDLYINPPHLLEDKGLTEFPLAMPEDVKTPGDPIKSYRDYYMKYKKDIVKWNHSQKPDWYEEI